MAVGSALTLKPGPEGERLMKAAHISLLALGGSLAALAGVIQAGTVAPPPATEFCAAPARTSAASAPSGTLPAEAVSQPAGILTVSGKDLLASLGCAPHAPVAAKAGKARPNVRNN